MRFLPGILVPVIAAFLLAPVAATANGAARGVKPIRTTVITNYDVKNKCTVVCKGRKPVLEYVEDGLAYALDIPLAILSPITCPLVAPILHGIDSDSDRVYSSKARRR